MRVTTLGGAPRARRLFDFVLNNTNCDIFQILVSFATFFKYLSKQCNLEKIKQTIQKFFIRQRVYFS